MKELTHTNVSLLPDGYAKWRRDIEQLIEVSKLRTAISVNSSMLALYWNIGKNILQKQQDEGWGKRS